MRSLTSLALLLLLVPGCADSQIYPGEEAQAKVECVLHGGMKYFKSTEGTNVIQGQSHWLYVACNDGSRHSIYINLARRASDGAKGP